jgi:uncharacterized protein YbaR (Trm112 family)
MALKKELLEIIACPKCKGDLDYKEADNELICRNCLLAYEVRNDIPIMLIDEAKKIEK